MAITISFISFNLKKDNRLARFIVLFFFVSAVGSWTVGDVVVDTHRKWIRLLKDHAHSFAENVRIHFAVNVFAVQADVARDFATFHEIVHAIQGFEQRAFSAAGRPDKCHDFILLNVQTDVFKCMKVSIVKVHALNGDFFFLCHEFFPSFLANLLDAQLMRRTTTIKMTDVA